jgi:hypothetical protein
MDYYAQDRMEPAMAIGAQLKPMHAQKEQISEKLDALLMDIQAKSWPPTFASTALDAVSAASDACGPLQGDF